MAMSGFLQCIVILRSFLRLLNLHKLAVGKLDLLRGVVIRSRCVRPWIKLMPEYPFNSPLRLMHSNS